MTFDKNASNEEIDETESDIKSTYVDHEFKQNVMMYLKYDDIMREKQKQIKNLKKDKKKCEDTIIKCLERSKCDHVNAKSSTLVLKETTSKSAINPELIKNAILEKTRGENIFDNEEKYNSFVESILETMENKRTVNRRVTLKRMINKN